MELTIAIWEDCKRLLTDNQSITCDRLQPFANINVHVESLVLDRFMSRFLSGDQATGRDQRHSL